MLKNTLLQVILQHHYFVISLIPLSLTVVW